MESQPQNPEFRINPENFHPCRSSFTLLTIQSLPFTHLSMVSEDLGSTQKMSISSPLDPFWTNGIYHESQEGPLYKLRSQSGVIFSKKKYCISFSEKLFWLSKQCRP